MKFGWLTLALSPSPDEDAMRIGQQISQVQEAEFLGFETSLPFLILIGCESY